MNDESLERQSSTVTCIKATARRPSSGTIRASSPCLCTGPTTFPSERGDLDVTFADGADDDEYLAALALHLPAVLDDTKPDLVFYLAGADPYAGDRLGKLALTIEGLRERDRYVFQECRARATPVVVAMSGGYAPDVEAIVTIHTNTIKEAARSDRCL